jgi:hypothetical protein
LAREHQVDEDRFRTILPAEIVWKPFPAFPPGARLAVMVGHPAEPGPYLVRVKVRGGTKLMPHKHPEDRIYTVMSGVFYIGLVRWRQGQGIPPGSVIVLAGETWHFHWVKSGEYVTQVSALGPLGLEYHDEQDDPRLGRRRLSRAGGASDGYRRRLRQSASTLRSSRRTAR